MCHLSLQLKECQIEEATIAPDMEEDGVPEGIVQEQGE
jgi:hypothetical protein